MPNVREQADQLLENVRGKVPQLLRRTSAERCLDGKELQQMQLGFSIVDVESFDGAKSFNPSIAFCTIGRTFSSSSAADLTMSSF